MSHVRWKATLLAATFAALLPGGAIAQATGAVEGRVTEQGTGRTLSGVQVFVAGTTVGTITASNGSYRIIGVPS
ncbi:MAG: carboxypeptidase-like regulatory domain-containing protein, partial [Gemmatimonadaceae bacterium]